jgi:hypothetical protein
LSSYVAVETGNLIIQGTDGPDNVEVVYKPGSGSGIFAALPRFEVTENGVTSSHSALFLKPTSRIEFKGNGGNDIFKNSTDTPCTAFGNNGNDTLIGGNNHDILIGGRDNDTLRGGAWNDRLYGREGADVIFGEGGNDGLFGGVGEHDRLNGGAGADRFLQPESEVNFNFIDDDVVEDRAWDDAIVEFTRLQNGKAWIDDEVQNIDLVLDLLHREVGNTTLLKRSDGGELNFTRYAGLGRGWNNGYVIGVTDMQFGGTGEFLCGYMLHEIGHHWNGNQLGGNRWTDFQNISNWTTTKPNDPAFAKAAEQNAWYETNTEFASGYARNTINDDWAESFAAYFMDQARWDFTKYQTNPSGPSGAAAAPRKMAFVNEWVANLS